MKKYVICDKEGCSYWGVFYPTKEAAEVAYKEGMKYCPDMVKDMVIMTKRQADKLDD